MHSKFLSVMLMALVFVVSCAAVPVKVPTSVSYSGNSTAVSGRNSSRTMGFIYGDFEDVNDHYAKDLPDWKKTNSYEFCFRDSCGAMTTLSGSQFIPKNYQHVANEARSKFYETRVCMDDTDPLYPSAIDVYLYNTNFVISWRFNYVNYWPCFSGGIN